MATPPTFLPAGLTPTYIPPPKQEPTPSASSSSSSSTTAQSELDSADLKLGEQLANVGQAGARDAIDKAVMADMRAYYDKNGSVDGYQQHLNDVLNWHQELSPENKQAISNFAAATMSGDPTAGVTSILTQALQTGSKDDIQNGLNMVADAYKEQYPNWGQDDLKQYLKSVCEKEQGNMKTTIPSEDWDGMYNQAIGG